jgi:hypothetical protein
MYSRGNEVGSKSYFMLSCVDNGNDLAGGMSVGHKNIDFGEKRAGFIHEVYFTVFQREYIFRWIGCAFTLVGMKCPFPLLRTDMKHGIRKYIYERVMVVAGIVHSTTAMIPVEMCKDDIRNAFGRVAVLFQGIHNILVQVQMIVFNEFVGHFIANACINNDSFCTRVNQ